MVQLKKILLLGFFVFAFVKNINAQQTINTNQSLNSKQHSIISIAAYTAKGNLAQLHKALNEGLDAGLTVNETKEVLVQLYAYAGFPRSLNAISILQTVINERRQKGINDIAGKESSKANFKNGKFEYGKNVQTQLTGTTSTGVPQKFVPVIDTFLKEHLFADIFSRDIFDFQTREIATISALASMSGTESQLQAHINVGKNAGLTELQLRSLAFVISTKIGWQEGNVTTKLIDKIFNSIDHTTTVTENANRQTPETVFPKGTRISNNNFTGTAWLQMLVSNDTTFNTYIGNVTFEPGARTNWHYHPGGQLLLVTSGKGRYQEQGKPVKEIHKGDVIKCDPNIIHWHGAAPDSELSHIAIGTNPDNGTVVWLKPVSDEEYNNPH